MLSADRPGVPTRRAKKAARRAKSGFSPSPVLAWWGENSRRNKSHPE